MGLKNFGLFAAYFLFSPFTENFYFLYCFGQGFLQPLLFGCNLRPFDAVAGDFGKIIVPEDKSLSDYNAR